MNNASILYHILPLVILCAVYLFAKMKENATLCFGAMVFFCGGCYLFYEGCKDFFEYWHEVDKATRSQSWPTADAVITKTGYSTRYVSPLKYRSSGPSYTLYVLTVSYDYEVDGTKYTSERIHPYHEFVAKNVVVRNGMYTQLSQKTMVAQLMAKGREVGIESGKKISVHYNPQNPEEATLLVGEMGDGNRVKLEGSIIHPIMGLVFWVFSLVIAWIIYRKKRAKITTEKPLDSAANLPKLPNQ